MRSDEIEPGVQVTLWPGHTPGNAVIDLRSKGARGVFSGDTIIERAYWGSRVLQIAFTKFMLAEKIRYPRQPILADGGQDGQGGDGDGVDESKSTEAIPEQQPEPALA